MNKALSATVFILWSASPCWAAVPAEPPTLNIVPSPVKGHPYPLWVSAREAADERGNLRADRLDGSARADLEQNAEVNRQHRLAHSSSSPGSTPPIAGIDCTELFGEPMMDRIVGKPNRSLKDLSQNAVAVYRGRIQKVEPGFSDGVPQVMLRIKVEDTLRQVPGERHLSHVFVIYPWARFWIGDRPFCTGTDDVHSPAVGESILFFRYDKSLSENTPVFPPYRWELVFETTAGKLVLPKALAQDDEVGPVGNLDEFVAILRRALGGQP